MMFSPKTAKQIAYFTVSPTKINREPVTIVTIHFKQWWKKKDKIIFEWNCTSDDGIHKHWLEPENVEITLSQLEEAIKSQSK